jgi:hypothetical protein
MGKFRDKSKVGRSVIVPFKPGETAGERHSRRLKSALAAKPQLEKACHALGISVEVSNEGHHWRFNGPFFAEWWPSSAKLVFNRCYSKGWHVHDWAQVLELLTTAHRESRKR